MTRQLVVMWRGATVTRAGTRVLSEDGSMVAAGAAAAVHSTNVAHSITGGTCRRLCACRPGGGSCAGLSCVELWRPSRQATAG
jgi:hypothetical protein